ncbi:DUF5654 family protein [Kyrpidia tusciae]|uniref:Uncharacterized protein n=1 Tax=Kyrpidia tusciae (strain DSM 2912 / NBRC 15312 / T2) TaxID=562970 RepID=D5WT55_KYRT2|nr:DUF5654 family protein [Kyrpidia tusciae]ADG05159.1 hypothetical protein Btus_0389 [Kyrpidia tusciae DSM 2912]
MVRTVLEKMIDLATAGFGLVAALAWNDLIKQLIQDFVSPYVPKGWGLFSMFLYALVVTALAVWITSYLGRLAALRREKDDAEAEKPSAEPAEPQTAIGAADIEEAVLRAMIRFRRMERGE